MNQLNEVNTVEKIANLVQIDLEIGDLDLELERRVHRVDVVEDVRDDARNDALQLLVAEHALHCVRLTRRCLTVCEYRAVVAREHIFTSIHLIKIFRLFLAIF